MIDYALPCHILFFARLQNSIGKQVDNPGIVHEYLRNGEVSLLVDGRKDTKIFEGLEYLLHGLMDNGSCAPFIINPLTYLHEGYGLAV